jgi:hypothetical protein
VIGDEPHRIDRLARRARRDEHAAPGEGVVAAFQQPPDVREDRLRLGHPTGTAPLARGEHSVIRLEQRVAERSQVRRVGARLRVRPHAIVHRRHEEHGRFGGEEARGEQVVRLPGGGARHEIRRGRRHDDGVRVAREVDVIEGATRIEQPRVHGPAGERLEGDGADELRRGARHHDVDLGARLREQPRQPRRLVARDAAGDAEQHAALREGANRWRRHVRRGEGPRQGAARMLTPRRDGGGRRDNRCRPWPAPRASAW